MSTVPANSPETARTRAPASPGRGGSRFDVRPSGASTRPRVPVRPWPHERDILDAVRRDGVPRVRAYTLAETAVVLGRGGRPERDLHLDAILEDHVPVYRRLGGGGAVVVGPGTVQVEACGLVPGPPNVTAWLRAFSEWLAAALQAAGVARPNLRDAADLTLGHRKVVGACLYRAAYLVHYSASILAEAPVELMERYLRPPHRTPAYRAGRPHRDFVASVGLRAMELSRRLEAILSPPDLFQPPGRLQGL